MVIPRLNKKQVDRLSEIYMLILSSVIALLFWIENIYILKDKK